MDIRSFFDYIKQRWMTRSYKAVLLLALMELVDDDGKIRLRDVVNYFRHFYLSRLQEGKAIDVDGTAINDVANMTDTEIARVILVNPFEKFEKRGFLEIDEHSETISFPKFLWEQFTASDKQRIQDIAMENLHWYYNSRVKGGF